MTSKLFERTGRARGQPREAKRTHAPIKNRAVHWEGYDSLRLEAVLFPRNAWANTGARLVCTLGCAALGQRDVQQPRDQ